MNKSIYNTCLFRHLRSYENRKCFLTTTEFFIIVFSIKNFKRYENIFGSEKSGELINNFSQLIISRLSETDFSVRYDRNKILVLLPGKDKKFGSVFANTIRNELMQKFKINEMQLLVTFLLSESPLDGNDLSSFTDNID